MADDQNQKPFDTTQGKPSTIDDLVKELSKNNGPNQPSLSRPGETSTKQLSSDKLVTSQEPSLPSATASQEPPSNLPGVKIENKLPVSPSSTPSRPSQTKSSPVLGQTWSGPQSSSSTKPPTSPVAPKFSPIQEYGSSIRTMNEDITSIKSGQKPLGVDIPRRVIPDMPKAPEISKPEISAPSGPTSSVELGKTEKTGSLPKLPGLVTSPNRPGPTIGLGQAGKTGSLPSPAPKKPAEPFKVPEIQPSITVPSEKKSLKLSMTSYALIAGVLIIGGFVYWFQILRIAEPEVVLSPTPTPTQTVTPAVKNLRDIFEGAPVNFEVVLSNDLGRDFKTFVGALSVTAKEFLKIDLAENVNGTLVPLNFMDMFDMDLTTYPAALKNNVVDSIVVAYGLSEAFNADGNINFNIKGLNRTAFVARIKDKTAVKTIMKDWEFTVADDLADYLFIADTSKESSANFLDNIYRGISIRYKNFPFPDTTVDYAIIEVAGQNYLAIASSREAIYAIADVLLGQ